MSGSLSLVPMKTLHRYILSELAGPFVVSLSLLTFILFMRNMVFLFPKIAGRNLEWSVIGELMGLSLPFIIALVLPMAVLVAVIMSFGRLSADNEITALKSLGVPAHRLMASPLAAALLLMVGAVWFNDRVLPESNHRYKNLLLDIAYLKPTVQIREGVVMDDFGGLSLLVNRIRETGGSRNLTLTAPDQGGGRTDDGPAELFGVVITETTPAGARRTIVADSGAIRTAPNRKDAVLILYDGEIQEVDSNRQEQFQRMFFTRHRIRLADVGGVLERGRGSRYRSDRELSLNMISEQIATHRRALDSLFVVAAALADSVPAGDSVLAGVGIVFGEKGAALAGRAAGGTTERISPTDSGFPANSYRNDPRTRLGSVLREAGFDRRRIASLRVEWWKKLSIPFASLVFVLLGVPLGIITRRGGAGVSISISMSVFLVYWVCLIAGETLADRLLVGPFWAMWTPNVLFLILGLWLLAVQVRGGKSLAIARSGLDVNVFRKLAGLFGYGRGAGEGTDQS